MATVTITIEEAEDDLLPNVCALTGRPTKEWDEEEFDYLPAFFYFMPPSRILRLIAWAVRKRQTVILPLAPSAQWHWLWRGLTWVGVLLLGLALIAFGLFGSDVAPPAAVAVSFILGLVAVFGSFILRGILRVTSLHATEITHHSITLTNVHPDFVAAVKEERDLRDEEEREEQERKNREWEEEQERRERRRERKRQAEREEAERPVHKATRVPPPPSARRVPDPPPKPKDSQEPWW